jgi:hypothetical protein
MPLRYLVKCIRYKGADRCFSSGQRRWISSGRWQSIKKSPRNRKVVSNEGRDRSDAEIHRHGQAELLQEVG